MPESTANAEWKGDLKGGSGHMKFSSFEGAFTFASRFESADETNPEELIAAAHAGCFSMAFSHGLASNGHTPTRVATSAKVHLNPIEGGFGITLIELTCEAEVPGIDDEAFQKYANEAKEGCPVSKALGGVPEIKLDAKLLG